MLRFIKQFFAVLASALLLFSCDARVGSESSRIDTARARRAAFRPYFGYEMKLSERLKERELADQMKTWDSSHQLIPWEDLSASVQRGESPDHQYWCVYYDKKKCHGCHELRTRIYYRQKTEAGKEPMEGWVILCLNCRKQVNFESIKH